jgi:CheY-like chemotaxis protein
MRVRLCGTDRAFHTRMRSSSSSGVRNRERARLLAHKRILIVDDEDDPRALLARILTSRGAHVSEASSAQEALDALKDMRFDAIISDLGMPERDGYGLIEDIRGQPGFANLPALALTAFTSGEARARGCAQGSTVTCINSLKPTSCSALWLYSSQEDAFPAPGSNAASLARLPPAYLR